MNTRYLYTVTALGAAGEIDAAAVAGYTDRHRTELVRPPLHPLDLDAAQRSPGGAGAVIEMVFGWPNRIHLRIAGAYLRRGRPVWFYWPREGAIEAIDRERLASYRKLWTVVQAFHAVVDGRAQARRFVAAYSPAWLRPHLARTYRGARAFASRLLGRTPSPAVSAAAWNSELEGFQAQLDAARANAAPVPLAAAAVPTPTRPMRGLGVYLRTDFWARISTGGSYGHTCYVAKELARTTERFTCLMPHRYVLLDELGLRQEVLPDPGTAADERAMIRANGHYRAAILATLGGERPAYIYERLCLGNYAGAAVSQDLQVPYLVEYNGSEISMRRSFGHGAYEHEAFFLRAEEAAFRQATAISVVSRIVRDELVERGVDPARILVNPNGVDTEDYAPVGAAERELLRRELGFAPESRVVGFIGTFGGWHGIDVLAAAIPQIAERAPDARFLLIGDGDRKPALDQAIRSHRLGDRVVVTGRVPHREGARLLGACDIYVSPHSSHMVDRRFFGSPTKLFEYMALGGGIVASDLEQIGEVLQPALRADALPGDGAPAGGARAMLCKPGDVAEFVSAVVHLCRNPELCRELGRNARAAAEAEYSWAGHVARLWQFAAHLQGTEQGRQQ
jgi:glycosyltransferase involved in cell wall biosynthesis